MYKTYYNLLAIVLAIVESCFIFHFFSILSYLLFGFVLCIVVILIVGERAKRARHSQVCSIENRGYIYYILCLVCAIFVLITRKEGGA